MAVIINEAEWQKLEGERKALQAKLEAERDALQAKLDAVVNYAPECWGDDPDAEDFVASLLTGTTTTPGHTDDCDCW